MRTRARSSGGSASRIRATVSAEAHAGADRRAAVWTKIFAGRGTLSHDAEYIDIAAGLHEAEYLELRRRSLLRQVRSSGVCAFANLADLAQHIVLLACGSLYVEKTEVVGRPSALLPRYWRRWVRGHDARWSMRIVHALSMCGYYFQY